MNYKKELITSAALIPPYTWFHLLLYKYKKELEKSSKTYCMVSGRASLYKIHFPKIQNGIFVHKNQILQNKDFRINIHINFLEYFLS